MVTKLDQWAAQQASHRLLMTSGDHRLFIIGTIHGNHWEQNSFPVTELDRLLIGFAPQLVLLEQRPDAPAYDGPPEMLYLRQRCREAHIPTCGIDWWTEAATPLTSDDNRERRITEHIQGAITSHPDAKTIAAFIGSSHVTPLAQHLAAADWQQSPDSPRVPTVVTPTALPAGWLALLESRVEAEHHAAITATSSERRKRHLENAAYFDTLRSSLS